MNDATIAVRTCTDTTPTAGPQKRDTGHVTHGCNQPRDHTGAHHCGTCGIRWAPKKPRPSYHDNHPFRA
ncbi:hypothetical protein [Nocardioides sp. ChNu-99]|uniref:hypothetical protein n=1 Tax=Nocardioides sp. ChNu-99 TaxID=2839897 RepID=UPI002406EDE8|nr:hypothetical protein [Nocardioides sp. ChNu-99]MDF9717372.1 hypothetical protein [Nocardioides sp. ChNu-99]